jgi:short-subunit dehydrogenase
MASRHRGAIVVVSSGSALTGMPQVSHYAATKAYGLQLATGLWAELERTGVDVLAVCPGLVRTRGTELHPPDLEAAPLVAMMEADQVVEQALAALARRAGPVFVPGQRERLSLEALSRLLPRSVALRWLRRTMHKLYPA